MHQEEDSYIAIKILFQIKRSSAIYSFSYLEVIFIPTLNSPSHSWCSLMAHPNRHESITRSSSIDDAANDLISLAKFFSPKNVAVIGASNNPSRFGYDVMKNLINAGFDGDRKSIV